MVIVDINFKDWALNHSSIEILWRFVELLERTVQLLKYDHG